MFKAIFKKQAAAIITLGAGAVVASVGLYAETAGADPGGRPAVGNPSNGRVVVRDHRGNGQAARPVVRDHRGQPQGRVVVRSRGGRVVVRPTGPAYGRDRRIVVVPARPSHPHYQDDQFLADLLIRHVSDLSCGQMGELLRRISNEVLSAQYAPDADEDYRQRYGSADERLRIGRLKYLRHMIKRGNFVKLVLDRLTSVYAGCDLPCFDDGVAVGLISGAGYCNAAIAVGGIGDDGFAYQEPLPICGTATFAGCQQGYSQAVNSTPGCLAYATGPNTETYLHSVSQDCHIDDLSPEQYP